MIPSMRIDTDKKFASVSSQYLRAVDVKTCEPTNSMSADYSADEVVSDDNQWSKDSEIRTE